MLRLDLKDNKETILLIEPKENVQIRKDEARSKNGPQWELWINVDSHVFWAQYYLEEERDDAYEYALNKIKEYLFSKGCLRKEDT